MISCFKVNSNAERQRQLVDEKCLIKKMKRQIKTQETQTSQQDKTGKYKNVKGGTRVTVGTIDGLLTRSLQV